MTGLLFLPALFAIQLLSTHVLTGSVRPLVVVPQCFGNAVLCALIMVWRPESEVLIGFLSVKEAGTVSSAAITWIVVMLLMRQDREHIGRAWLYPWSFVGFCLVTALRHVGLEWMPHA